MTLIQKLQQGDYYEISILDGMYAFVTADGKSAFAVVDSILDHMGFDDRMMKMGENPLYEKTGDGKHVLATITCYKPDGTPYSTEEFRQRGALAAASGDSAQKE